MPAELNPYQTMRIWETVEFKHMAKKDKEYMLSCMDQLYTKIDSGKGARSAATLAGAAIVGAVAGALAWKNFK